MADTIKIGNTDISAFKVGSADCTIYLGDTLLYPKTNYFTIRSLTDNNTITLTNNTTGSTAPTHCSFLYSTDGGANWSNLTTSTRTTYTLGSINSGGTLIMKAVTTNQSLGINYNYGHYFRASGDFEVEGNLMSLLTGNETDTEFIGGSYNFAQLFSGCTNLVNAENLIIPASAMTSNAFNGTFRGCTSLTKAPELPAKVMANACYSSMFEGCTSLSKPPSVLNVNGVEGSCFQRMFCMSRNSMVTSAMKYTPKMYGSYNTATFAQQMFCGNGSLETVECYMTKTSGDFSQTNWMQYTNSTGTFKKLSTQTFVSGVNGIPDGWTVLNV